MIQKWILGYGRMHDQRISAAKKAQRLALAFQYDGNQTLGDPIASSLRTNFERVHLVCAF